MNSRAACVALVEQTGGFAENAAISNAAVAIWFRAVPTLHRHWHCRGRRGRSRLPRMQSSPAMSAPTDGATADPPHDCALCPRLVATRAANRVAQPDWFNAPVPGWGDAGGWLAVVGLAPGRAGGNRTGRPFTGDAAGRLLHATLARLGLSHGEAGDSADDGLVADGVFITNAVRCVPPGNKPTPAEIHACRPFLAAQLGALPGLKVIIALGEIAHQSAVKACGGKLPKAPFGHGHVHHLNGQHFGAVTLIDSYHPSQLNTATGRLTPEMFEAVFVAAQAAR